MYDSSLSALSDAWESIAAAKKELTNVDAKIRQSGVRPLPDSTKYSFGNSISHPSRKSKDNQNIERRVVVEHPCQAKGMYRKENIPPLSFLQPQIFPDILNKGKGNFTFDEFVAMRKEQHNSTSIKPMECDINKSMEDYQPDFNYVPNRNIPTGLLNTSLSGRILLTKETNSNALLRLKEKINQQKSLNTSQVVPFPESHGHTSEDPVKLNDETMSIKEPMKRKIAHAPSVPTYKGFNQPNGNISKPPVPRECKIQKKNQMKSSKANSNYGKTSKEKKPEQNKMNRKVKTKVKMQRIVSPKKPVPSISTFSWRVGQEIREKILKERKIKKNSMMSVPETTKETTDTSSYQAEKPDEYTNSATKPTSKSVSELDEKVESKADENTEMDVSLPTDGSQEKREKSEVSKQQHVQENPVANIEAAMEPIDFKISVDNSGELKFPSDICEPVVQDFKMSKNVKSIITDLSEIPKDKSVSRKKKRVTGVIDTGLKKKKVGKTSPSVKRKSEEESYPKQKIRHYDQEEIQKYMQKQQAERKKQRLKEKQQKQHTLEAQQKNLQELYDKQKAAVKENLETVKRNVYGETFIKLTSKLSSIMTDPSYNSTQESTDMTTSNDIPTYPLPQASSPQPRKEQSQDEIFKDSLEVSRDQNTLFHPISPYKPSSVTSNTRFVNQPDVDNVKPVDQSDVQSKANRVAAIHSTASALRKRLDMEAKRISTLVQSRQANHTKSIGGTNMHSISVITEAQGFSGDIPGTQNIDEQANFNVKLQRMEEAAKKNPSIL